MIVWDELAVLRHKLKWANIQIAVLWGCLAVTWVFNLVRAWTASHGH